jgi:hypothetical protein
LMVGVALFFGVARDYGIVWKWSEEKENLKEK